MAKNAQIWGFGLEIFENKCQIQKKHFRNKVQNFVKIEINTFWYKMSKFLDFGSKFSKTNDSFEISTFEIGYMGNFVKSVPSK